MPRLVATGVRARKRLEARLQIHGCIRLLKRPLARARRMQGSGEISGADHVIRLPGGGDAAEQRTMHAKAAPKALEDIVDDDRFVLVARRKRWSSERVIRKLLIHNQAVRFASGPG